MGTDVYEDAIVDVVGPETVLSEPCTIKVSGCPPSHPTPY